MVKVFIDGKEGTTGLQIYERFAKRSDVELLVLDEKFRKDVNARKDYINKSDITFLCLPDDAARQSVSLLENNDTVIIDTSTAHRTENGWAYGFAELSPKHRQAIKDGKLIANPGCHASGFIALVYPLVANGIMPKNTALSCFSLTGYSGGGKKMIAEYESENRNAYLNSPRQYGLTQTHKHLPEMKAVCALDNEPIFCPIVANFDRGMEVTVPLFKKDLNGNVSDIINAYKSVYTGEVVKYVDDSENGFCLQTL
jgi:N-acetyl-gamma-glutamyl-phosphate reductase